MNGCRVTEVNRLWSHQETAAFLGISVKTLYQMNWKGTGPRGFRVGRHRRYAAADVQAWLSRRAIEPAEQS